ncbi:hypothetical protein FG386_000854 [Cryptosporidium ryanae]|uniref:uncharacterized protein n=1 Tax=Cryptosporidium ryanae TaxID=515981 RepID=UPI00351A15D7|nr:hypothetical protein FG386_000854 [Cryptosporidium ryanae]
MHEKRKNRDDWRVYLDQFVDSIRKREIIGSQTQGKRTLEVLRHIIDRYSWKNGSELYKTIREIGSEIVSIDPSAFSVGITVRRILNVIRKEYMKLSPNTPTQMYYFEGTENCDSYLSGNVNMFLLRSAIFEGINELLHEFGQSWDFDLCLDIFTQGEKILIYGYSDLFERLLKFISKKKHNLTVFIVNGDPENNSEVLISKITQEHGINTIVISDSCIFNVMPKVNKVILSANAIFPDGSAVTLSGGYLISQAANYFSVPIIVISALYNLSYFPLFDTHNTSLTIPPNLFSDSLKQLLNVHFTIEKLDLIPGNLIHMFLTENGSITSLHLYNIYKLRFHFNDVDIYPNIS